MKKNIHKVFALKYRPKNFKELIGQNVMLQTITNSIKYNKLPNAYLLTGIRGVGKTTTARLIAKAINCKKSFDLEEKCGESEYCHCKDPPYRSVYRLSCRWYGRWSMVADHRLTVSLNPLVPDGTHPYHPASA